MQGIFLASSKRDEGTPFHRGTHLNRPLYLVVGRATKLVSCTADNKHCNDRTHGHPYGIERVRVLAVNQVLVHRDVNGYGSVLFWLVPVRSGDMTGFSTPIVEHNLLVQ